MQTSCIKRGNLLLDIEPITSKKWSSLFSCVITLGNLAVNLKHKPTSNIRQKILLVDDEPDLTTVFSIGLVDNGFKVDVFNDPLLALAGFKKGHTI